jgi:Recombination endonuclease VII
VPYKDPEVRRAYNREYKRAYIAKNRDKINARKRELRAQNPDQERERQRRYYERNRDAVLERGKVRGRAHYEKNREERKLWQREYNARNRDAVNERGRQRYRSAGQERMRAWRMLAKHGLRPEDWASIWDAQQGRCYLCGDELDAQKAVLDHDHSCCPGEKSCRVCHRGLTCANCNSAIGMAHDDPGRLRRMADALEAAQAVVNQRQAGAGEELVLFAI